MARPSWSEHCVTLWAPVFSIDHSARPGHPFTIAQQSFLMAMLLLQRRRTSKQNTTTTRKCSFICIAPDRFLVFLGSFHLMIVSSHFTQIIFWAYERWNLPSSPGLPKENLCCQAASRYHWCPSHKQMPRTESKYRPSCWPPFPETISFLWRYPWEGRSCQKVCLDGLTPHDEKPIPAWMNQEPYLAPLVKLN